MKRCQCSACLCMQTQGASLRLWHQPACRCRGPLRLLHVSACRCREFSGSGISLHADAAASQAPACVCVQMQGTSQALASPCMQTQGPLRLLHVSVRRRRGRLKLYKEREGQGGGGVNWNLNSRARAHSVCDNFHFYFSDFSDLYFPIFRISPESPGDFSNSRDVLQTGKIKFPDGPGGKIGTEKSENNKYKT